VDVGEDGEGGVNKDWTRPDKSLFQSRSDLGLTVNLKSRDRLCGVNSDFTLLRGVRR
jgi:hypothetical protein